jgi:dienelactone hydrolase
MEGVYGFCWGGKQVVESVKLFKAAAVVHPAFLEVSDADKISVPFALIDSEDEPKETMDELYSVLEKKPFADKNFRHRYEIFHGFCAGRANYEDPENGKLAREVCLPSPSLSSSIDFMFHYIFFEIGVLMTL